MSNDFISRKALIDEINSFNTNVTGLKAGKGILNQYAEEYKKSIIDMLVEIPTAYDVDKVVEKLKDKEFKADFHKYGGNWQDTDNLIRSSEVYNIVREGGV